MIDSPFPVNPAGFTIHSCIHEAREDAGCVLHTHSRAGVAVSAQKGGVLPICQQSTFVLASLAYHDYEGVALRDDEKPRLQADLGDEELPHAAQPRPADRGQTSPMPSSSMYTFENTCRIQIDAQAGGELVHVDPKIMEGMAQVMKTVTAGQGANIAWPALLRKLDRRGSRRTRTEAVTPRDRRQPARPVTPVSLQRASAGAGVGAATSRGRGSCSSTITSLRVICTCRTWC